MTGAKSFLEFAAGAFVYGCELQQSGNNFLRGKEKVKQEKREKRSIDKACGRDEEKEKVRLTNVYGMHVAPKKDGYELDMDRCISIHCSILTLDVCKIFLSHLSCPV